jgi:Flp pilus assembly protein TadG
MTTSSSRPGGTHLAGERAPRRGRRDQGSAATELTIWTPLLILILLFVVSCGRLVQAQLRLSDAAHSAARAASLARDPASASRAATAAVQPPCRGEVPPARTPTSPSTRPRSCPAVPSPSG